MLVACSTVPLIAWRRFPLVVFAITATAGVLLAGRYPLDLMLGPAAALYLLVASRERETPWTWRTTALVIGLFLTYLGPPSSGRGTFRD